MGSEGGALARVAHFSGESMGIPVMAALAVICNNDEGGGEEVSRLRMCCRAVCLAVALD